MNSIVFFGLSLFLLVVLLRTIKIVPQKQVKIIERLGKYHRTAEAGLNTILPFLDSVRATIDLREQITKIEPQPVITRDNVTMEVDAVIYYLIADPVRATYEVQNLPWGLEQLTLSALRNVIGQLDLDHTLSSRDTTNSQLRAALDSATQQWGVKVMRIELKNITPPEEIRLTMEKQMTAERTRRAVVTTAEGEKSSAILRAEGQKQAQIVNAGGREGSGDSGRRRPGAGAAARGAGRSAGDSGDRAGARRRRQPRAVPDRAAISRVARQHRDRRAEAGVPAVRSERRHGVARRHQRAAAGRRGAEDVGRKNEDLLIGSSCPAEPPSSRPVRSAPLDPPPSPMISGHRSRHG